MAGSSSLPFLLPSPTPLSIIYPITLSPKRYILFIVYISLFHKINVCMYSYVILYIIYINARAREYIEGTGKREKKREAPATWPGI